MTSYLDPKRLEDFLVHILTPIHRITEDDTIRDPQMSKLYLLSREIIPPNHHPR
jgi:U3 small nucleolar RNA-associated protein 20